jgi:xanthine dehydrogenase accessory factor
MPEVENELARRLEAGEEVLLATVVSVDGEPPSRPGAKALLSRAAPLSGTLGCAEFDSAALSDAPSLLDSGTPGIRTYRHDLGSIQVYLEPYAAQPVLLVLAAGPVARNLVRWAPELGFRPLLYESRAERRLEGLRVDLMQRPDELAGLKGSEIYAVHTDHDAPDLEEVLKALLSLEPRFLGLMGSRRHTGHHLEALRARGLPALALDTIQTPVGIDIGARTASEIALSILAGVVAARHGAQPGWLDPGR